MGDWWERFGLFQVRVLTYKKPEEGGLIPKPVLFLKQQMENVAPVLLMQVRPPRELLGERKADYNANSQLTTRLSPLLPRHSQSAIGTMTSLYKTTHI